MTNIHLQRLESQRSTLLKTKKALIITSVILIVPAYLFSAQNSFAYIIFILAVPISTLMWFGYKSSFNNFRKTFKITVIQSIIKQFFPYIIYYPEQVIARSIFDQSRIFPSDYTEFKGEDLLVSSIYGNLQMSEVSVRRIQKNKNDKTIITNYITGLFGVATFPFRFAGTTVVYPKGFLHKAFGGQKVILESPNFMEIFDIVTTNQIEARLALGTDIMNNILYLHDELKTKVWLSFVDNQVFFGIEDLKFLEPDLNVTVTNQTAINNFKKELEIINNLIQTFKLHQNK